MPKFFKRPYTGGKGGVANGGVRRGYSNSYGGIHIYEDAKVTLSSGKTLVGADAAARIIAGHELTHVLESRSPEQYKEYEKFVLQHMDKDTTKIYMSNHGLDSASARSEIVADYTMKFLFSDEKIAREITKKHSKLAEAIRRALKWIREKLGYKMTDIERAAELWNKAYNESRRADGATGNGVKNSVTIDNRPIKDYNEFDEALNRQQWAQFYREAELREELGELNRDVNVYFTESGTPKLVFFKYVPEARGKFQVFEAYKGINVLENEILQLRKGFTNGQIGELNKSIHGFLESGELQRFDIRVRDYLHYTDTQGAIANVSGHNLGTGRAKSAGKRNSTGDSEHGSGSLRGKRITTEADSTESAFSNGKVKNSIATKMTDSDGNSLTEQQAEYFANSKVRDGKGNLRIVYHNTNSEFTVFDLSRSGSNQGKTHGDGIYLSTSPTMFDYAGDIQMRMYADIRNPFEMDLSQREAERIYDIYFKPFHEDRFNTYRPHVLSALQSSTKVFDYLSEAAEKNNVKISDILKELGYDGVHDGSEWVAFDGAQVKNISNKTPTSNPDINYSNSATDATFDAIVRQMEAESARKTSLAEALRRNEQNARDMKRDFSPSEDVVAKVANAFAEIGLADGATQDGIAKATAEASIASSLPHTIRKMVSFRIC